MLSLTSLRFISFLLYYRTLSVECCYQNVGIATSVALTMFQGEQLATAMAVPLYYGLLEAAILGFYCIVAWKAGWTKAPRNIGFLTMIGTSYEVLTTEHGDLISVEVSLAKNQKDLKEKRKMSKYGDTIHISHSIDEEQKDDVEKNIEENSEEENVSGPWWSCFATPSTRKEASGFVLPEVPDESEADGCDDANVFHLWKR